MKSRVAKLLGHSFYLLSIIALLFCIIVRPNNIIFIFVLVCFLFGSLLYLLLSRCPHCHRIGGLRLTPIKKTTEKCKHCGNIVEYRN